MYHCYQSIIVKINIFQFILDYGMVLYIFIKITYFFIRKPLLLKILPLFCFSVLAGTQCSIFFLLILLSVKIVKKRKN